MSRYPFESSICRRSPSVSEEVQDKLKPELTEIREDLNQLKDNLNKINGDVDEIKAFLGELKEMIMTLPPVCGGDYLSVAQRNVGKYGMEA